MSPRASQFWGDRPCSFTVPLPEDLLWPLLSCTVLGKGLEPTQWACSPGASSRADRDAVRPHETLGLLGRSHVGWQWGERGIWGPGSHPRRRGGEGRLRRGHQGGMEGSHAQGGEPGQGQREQWAGRVGRGEGTEGHRRVEQEREKEEEG